MEKKQYELFIEVLKRLNGVGVLNHVILVGSWCALFYNDYFQEKGSLPALKTRDMDFLIPIPFKFKGKIDLPELLKDLGFVIEFKGSHGYIRLDHPELILEFLIPEKGKGSDKPYPLPQLGMNAQPLRFLNLLTQNTIYSKIENIQVTVPHPINFALHKLIISKRRRKEDKAKKDQMLGIIILKRLMDEGKSDKIFELFDSFPRKWKNKIMQVIEDEKEYDIIKTLKRK